MGKLCAVVSKNFFGLTAAGQAQATSSCTMPFARSQAASLYSVQGNGTVLMHETAVSSFFCQHGVPGASYIITHGVFRACACVLKEKKDRKQGPHTKTSL
jgi:hypothetical protein